MDIPESDDKYLRYTLLQTDIQNQDDIFDIFYEFDIILKSINFDFNQVAQIYPYNTSSEIYSLYTGSNGEYVDPQNKTIKSIGDSLWTQSSDIIDYAQKCYEYIAINFDYLKPNTGLHPLKNILDDGGGDCGNLSSIFVSLLRYKDIPSRHIVTIRPDGSYHVWADFYLENYGWIPVDITYKQSNQNGNYFGVYDGSGIVVTKKVWLLINTDISNSYNAALLQNYHWLYWYEDGGCNSIETEHFVNSSIPKYINTYYRDFDNDDYGNPNDQIELASQPSGYVDNDNDCDDTDSSVHPGAIEIRMDGIDQDCDGQDLPGLIYYHDNDSDGYGDPNGPVESASQPSGYVEDNTDCDDDNDIIYPGATENRGDGIDQDCNGEDLPELTTYYRDGDSDGYGDANDSRDGDTQPTGYVTNSNDCNDSNSNIHPGAIDQCNGVDDNCNGELDVNGHEEVSHLWS